MTDRVAWQVWDEEALALAKNRNRLLFLNIGYASCHCQFILGPVLKRSSLTLTLRVPCHGTRIVLDA